MNDAAATQAGPRRRRGGLSKAVIVDHAIRIAEDEGTGSLSMRRLATDLHTAPMSLYRHLEDRNALLIAMLDRVAEQVVLPDAAASPRAEIEAVATAIHDALAANRWAVALIAVDKLASPIILPAIERIYAAFDNAGMTPQQAAAARGLVWHYIVGELIDSHHDQADDFRRTMVGRADASHYPHLTRAAQSASASEPTDHFTQNLGAVLDGLGVPG